MYDILTDTLFYRKPRLPCKDCTGRFVGCHSTCKKYNDWVKAERKINDEIRQKKKEELYDRQRDR